MIETWYLLTDGAYADPSECSTGDDGVLRHASGREVVMREVPNVPHSRSVDPDEERAKAKKDAKQVTPEKPAGSYKTRESRAR